LACDWRVFDDVKLYPTTTTVTDPETVGLRLPSHANCTGEKSRLDAEDVDSLTLTATMVVEVEKIILVKTAVDHPDGSRDFELEQGPVPISEQTKTFSVGPLRFSELQTVGSVSFTVAEIPEPGDSPVPDFSQEAQLIGYRVVARMLNCELSNGTPCGNNIASLEFTVLSQSRANATPTPSTGTSSSGLTGSASPTPTQPSNPGSSNTGVTRGTFTSLSPNTNGMTLGSANSVALTVSGDGAVSATFELSYYFGQSSQSQFRFTGRLEGERSGDHVSGTVTLDQPAADALSSQFEFGGNSATWEADITATGVTGAVHLLDGSDLAFSTRSAPAP
jgi:hypothetical protein